MTLRGFPTVVVASIVACSLCDCYRSVHGISDGAIAVDTGIEAQTDASAVDVADALTTPLTPSVDLLMMIDNSNSMRDNQTEIMQQLAGMIGALVEPLCTSATNPTPHVCNASDPSDTPQHQPLESLNVGVIDSDLGTPGANVPGCQSAMFGDDGLLNPIRNGMAEVQHEPWTSAPASFGRPASCTDPNQYPSFITYDSTAAATMGSAYTSRFVTDFQCNAGLYVNGCGLESQLEAIWRALIWHDASDRVGNTDSNAGFMRDDAVLVILVLTDEEDTSVRNCNYAHGMPCVTDHSDPNPMHRDALEFYQSASTSWSSPNLNMRCYMYQPGGEQDPAWPLERYIDPNDLTAGLPGLKRGHPERVLFAAITGVPLAGWQNTDGTTNWDALLGTPGPGGPNDYYGRSAGPGSAAINDFLGPTSPEGPISMYQANQDPGCTERTVPGCRRQGSHYPGLGMECTTDVQYYAWPVRRVTEVARRFEQATFCPGGACGNGLIASICATDYTAAMASLEGLIGRVLPRM